MKPRKSPRRTVGAMYVDFSGETQKIRVLALTLDTKTGMYETEGSWDLLRVTPGETLILRDGSPYGIVQVFPLAHTLNRTKLILKQMPRAPWWSQY
jgi:hypothetical protein